MFKKLLITLCVLSSASFLSAADTTKVEDDVLSGVKQLSQEQMESVTGEDIYFYYYYPSTDTYEQFAVNRGYVCGEIIVNGETGELISANTWTP